MQNKINLSKILTDVLEGNIKANDGKKEINEWLTLQYVTAGIYTEPMLTTVQMDASILLTAQADDSKPHSKVVPVSKPSQVVGRAMSVYAMAIYAASIHLHGFSEAHRQLVRTLVTKTPSDIELEGRFAERTVEFGKTTSSWPFTVSDIETLALALGVTDPFPTLATLPTIINGIVLELAVNDGSDTNEFIPDVPSTPSTSDAQVNALNYMLSSYTKGEVTDWTAFLHDYKSALTSVTESADKVVDLERKLLAEKSMTKATATPIKGDGTIPDGKPVYANAKDVFGIDDPRLDFDVVTYQWDAENPHVPDLIPSYHFNTEVLSSFLWAQLFNSNCWFKGHTGTGKTTFIEQVCARLHKMCFRLSCDVGVENYHVIGNKDVIVKEGVSVTTFTEAILPKAMVLPSQFIIDEADALRGDIAYLFQPVLEGQPLRINEDGGRLVVPHPQFCIAATANSGGNGDDTALYAAAVKTQSTAQLNRYNQFYEIDYMSADEEIAVVRQVVPNLSDISAENLRTFLKDYRKGFQDGTMSTPVSPRNSITIAKYCSFFEEKMGAGDAFRAAVRSNITMRCHDMDKSRINELVERIARGATMETTQETDDGVPF